MIWRGRLQLFWVTFSEKADEEAASPDGDFEGLKDNPVSGQLQKVVEAQLNWAELFQGQWSTRGSSGFASPIRAQVPRRFDHSELFIHVTKERSDLGEDRAMRIHLNGENFNNIVLHIEWIGDNRVVTAVKNFTSFRIASKNAEPTIVEREEPPTVPYSAHDVQATRLTGMGALSVTYSHEVDAVSGAGSTPTAETILGTVGSYTVLPCSSPTVRASSDSARGPLESPFFVSTEDHTFYVEPSLTEVPFQLYEGWIPAPRVVQYVPSPSVATVKPYIPSLELAAPPAVLPDEPDDWLVRDNVGLRYGNVVVGAAGAPEFASASTSSLGLNSPTARSRPPNWRGFEEPARRERPAGRFSPHLEVDGERRESP